MAEVFRRDLSTMDTQQAVDALTDHMAIYHRSAERLKAGRSTGGDLKNNPKPGAKGGNVVKQRVIEWLSELSTSQRQAVLTVFDRSWVLLLLQMQQKLNENGPGNFIILPDIPASSLSVRSNTEVLSHSSKHQRGKNKKGRASSNTRRGRTSKVSRTNNDDHLEGNRKFEGHTGSTGVAKFAAEKVFPLDSVTLPGLCYRKANGLLARLKSQQLAEEKLRKAVQIFSSQDGHKSLISCGSEPVFDALSLSSELAENLDVFLEVMGEISYGEFLEHPLGLTASPWEETPWLQVQGYYSVAAFIANKLEICIWSSYSLSMGSKRSFKNQWIIKTSESLRSKWTSGRSVDVLESAAAAQSLHERKRGCIDWWNRVDCDLKEKTVRSALIAATKFEVISAVSSARSAIRSIKPAHRSHELLEATKYRGKNTRWTSLSDTEVEHHKLDLKNSWSTSTLSPLLLGLAALKEAAESGILSGESLTIAPRSNNLFFSNLESVHTLPDRIVRRSRNVLARVMNEAVEYELLQGEVGTNSLGAGTAIIGESKGVKDKKKRRKRSSVQKTGPERKDLADLDCKTSEDCSSAARNEDKKGADPQFLSAKIPNGAVGCSDFCVGTIQNSNPQTRKPMNQKHGKVAHTGPGVSTSDLHEHKGQFERFGTNISRDDETCGSEPVASPCYTFVVDIKSTTTPVCDAGQAPFMAHGNLCNSKLELCAGCGDRAVLDAANQRHGEVANMVSNTSDLINAAQGLEIHDRNGYLRQSDEVNTRVLSPVGEEPSVGQAGSEVLEALNVEQDLQKQFDMPESIYDHDFNLQRRESRSLQLRFGTIEVVTSDVQVPVKSSISSKALGQHSIIPETPGNGRKCRGLDELRIAEESWDTAHNVEATPEPVYDSNLRRSGHRSQSLPSGISASGKLFASQPAPTFFPEEPVLVRKGGSLRSQHNTPAFAMFYSHEWPGYSQVRVPGSTVRPTATERLHLDVVHDWPKCLGASSVSISNTVPAPGNLDWSPLVHNGYSLTPMVGYADSNEPKVVTLSPFSSSPYASRTPPNGHTRLGEDSEVEERLYDTDLEIFDAGDFGDLDGYLVSEEEGERQIEDNAHVKAEDYNQVFGGGVMYWNSADYTGMGYSRPGSMSSDDSSWARREADLGAVLDDIVGIPYGVPYGSKGSTSSNLSSTSPSQPSTSLPVPFDQIGGSQVGPRVCLTRPTGSDFSVSYRAFSDDSQTAGTNVGNSAGVVDGIMSDGFMPRLRPIVVMRDPGLSRSMGKNEAVRLRELRSPHIVSRGAPDFPGDRRRRPSPPVTRHAPPPPPPSPVAGLKRRKGWMSARSGSSSPRHWGLTSWWNKDDVDNFEVQAAGRDNALENGRRMAILASTPPIRPMSRVLPLEHSVAIHSSALDQEHMADEALVMQSTVLFNKNPSLQLVITLFHKSLHKEIETFCLQVAAEKRLRMPFINTAVKKVTHSLQVLWPRSRAKIFGSNATGLALPTSDVDIVVSLPPVRKARNPIKQAGILEGRIDGVKETCLLHAARNLEDQDWVKSLQVFERTMVPIIRLEAHILPHQCELGDISLSVKETCPMGSSNDAQDGSPTSQDSGDSGEKEGPWGSNKDRQIVRLDISFESLANTGLRTSELVRELVGQFPPLTPLALVSKQFLADRSLDHAYKGGLSSYCQVLLITRFLQHQQHLGRPSSSQNLGSLFMDFLHFFGYVFDPRSMCVRIRGGGKYVSRDRGPSIDPLYIEDPFDYENNVGSTCFRIQQIVKAFADADSILEKELFEASATDGSEGEDRFYLLRKIMPSFVGK